MSAKKGHIQTCKTECCWANKLHCRGNVKLYGYVLNHSLYSPRHVCDFHAACQGYRPFHTAVRSYRCLQDWSVIEHDPQNKDCTFE